MKNKLFIVAFFVLFMILTTASASNKQEKTEFDNYLNAISIKEPSNNEKTFQLPASVLIIEDGAFEGTAITNVILPETLNIIGDRAFANIVTLKSIRISAATKSISKSAFVGSDNVMITAISNSYAIAWAKENKIPFSSLTLICAGIENLNIASSLINVNSEICLNTKFTKINMTIRRWGKYEEKRIAKTSEIVADHIPSRAPPVVLEDRTIVKIDL